MFTKEDAGRLTGEPWGQDNYQWEKLRSWLYFQQGIEVAPHPDDPLVIRAEQIALTERGCLYTRTQLYEKARQLYPDKKHKIRPLEP